MCLASIPARSSLGGAATCHVRTFLHGPKGVRSLQVSNMLVSSLNFEKYPVAPNDVCVVSWEPITTQFTDSIYWKRLARITWQWTGIKQDARVDCMHCLIRWLVSHAKKVAFLLVLTRPDYLCGALGKPCTLPKKNMLFYCWFRMQHHFSK